MITIRHCKSALAIAALFAASGAYAGTMSKAEFSAAKDRIEADYKTDKAGCDSLAGNAKDICVEQVKGKNKVARAELEANYSGKAADFNKLEITRADADFAVAKERCDDKGGNAKDVCVTEAKSTHTKALVDAKLGKKVGEARKDAVDDKRDADYKVAAEKCESLSGDAKAACISDAKMRFHKS
jgi:hypothetical protein